MSILLNVLIVLRSLNGETNGPKKCKTRGPPREFIIQEATQRMGQYHETKRGRHWTAGWRHRVLWRWAKATCPSTTTLRGHAAVTRAGKTAKRRPPHCQVRIYAGGNPNDMADAALHPPYWWWGQAFSETEESSPPRVSY